MSPLIRHADIEEGLARHGGGGEVDHAAAEFAGIIDRIALLDERRGDHAGRENVERDDAPERLRAGQRQTVEQRERITIAQAAHEDEAVADHGKAGDALQRAGDVAFAGAGDIRAGEDRDHLRRLPDDAVRAARAGDDDVGARRGDLNVLAGIVLRRGRVGLGLILSRRRRGGLRHRLRCRLPLTEGDPRRDERRGEEQGRVSHSPVHLVPPSVRGAVVVAIKPA